MGWKKLLLTSLVAFLCASTVALGLRYLHDRTSLAQPKPPEPLPEAVIVFCFHGKERDEKCKKIEEYTHELLKKSFAEPLKEGKIVWRVLDFEAPENARFKDNFQLIASCIVVADARAGQTVTAKNLQRKVMELVDNKEVFMAYVQTEIEKTLKGPVDQGTAAGE